MSNHILARTKQSLVALLVSCLPAAAWSPLPATAADTAVRVAGNQVFVIQSDAGGISAARRAEIIQNNLDNALVAANDRSPNAVNITYVKGLPVVTLDGYYLGTVDSRSAALSGTTAAALAQRWADSLRRALADEASITGYVAQLAGNSSTSGAAQSTAYKQARLIFVPAGMVLPITLKTSLSSQAAKAGDPVEAKVARDVFLGSAYIPRGTVISGRITDARAGSRMAKSGMVGLKFEKIRMPDGTESPITGQLVGGIEEYGGSAGARGSVLKGETGTTKVKQAAVRGAIGAGAGALIGTTIGAIAGRSGGAVGRGAISGLAIGAGLGVAESLLVRKGGDVIIPSGKTLELKVDAPVTLSTYF